MRQDWLYTSVIKVKKQTSYIYLTAFVNLIDVVELVTYLLYPETIGKQSKIVY